MKPTLRTLTRSTFSSLKAAPLVFFALQFLEGIASIIAKLLEGHFETNPVVGVLLFFPVFCIASTVSNALTFLYIREQDAERRVTLSETLLLLRPSLGKLIVASMALGLVFVLGFAALILPAFYFMAIYLFVPQLILGDKNLSLSLALFRSTKLSKRALKLSLLTVVMGLGIGVATFLVSESLGRWAGGITETRLLRYSISLSIDAFLSMSTGAIIDVWISHLFLGLNKNE